MKLPKHAELWLAPYIADRARRLLRRASGRRKPRRLHVAITDHFEPMGGRVSLQQGHARLKPWHELWPRIADAAPRDAAGQPPKYTFFYPQEEYVPEILSSIRQIVDTGFADVEVHLHHDNDTAANMEQNLRTFLRQLHEDHGLLHTHNGQLVFGFIHGNWALDNSRPDGRWCGVQGELQLLRRLSCYADFTMPSIPSPTQGRILNQVYWTNGDPARPKGFNTGIEAQPGAGEQGNGLLMVTGPFGWRYRERLLPRMEMGELAHNDVPTPYRVQRWLALAPQLGDTIFLKLFGHSAREDNATALLGTPTRANTLGPMFNWIAQAAQQHHLELHWSTAYEMYAAIDRIIQQQ